MQLPIKERFSLNRFLLGEKHAAQPITLGHRRIFILPTLKGFALAFILMAMLIASTVYGNNLGFILTFLLVGIAIVSIIHSFRELAGLKFRSQAGKPVYCGEPALILCRLNNPSHFVRNSLWMIAKNGSRECIDIGAQRTREITLSQITIRRGWHAVGTITIECYFPLGIFRAWSPLLLDEKILVYPAPAATHLPFPKNSRVHADAMENDAGDEDFKGFQHYQPGDSPRKINWKALAKEHGLYTKQYESSENTEIWLNWHDTPGQTTEQRLSQLCRWIIDAEQTNIHYGLRLPAIEFEPGIGESHRANCLKALALFGDTQ